MNHNSIAETNSRETYKVTKLLLFEFQQTKNNMTRMSKVTALCIMKYQANTFIMNGSV